ncbi:MAG: HEPN domain-containing protein [Armatimonadetes bacterium]|nr:HEPN domain-containing protein [Armatimonadota bacterium]
MIDLDHARELLELAEEDLRTVCGMADATVFAERAFCLHAQQATEKALKAWLTLRGRPYPFIHDLLRLMRLLAEMGEGTSAYEHLAWLTLYAGGFRYERVPPDMERSCDRSELTAQVTGLLRHVRQLLEEAPP